MAWSIYDNLLAQLALAVALTFAGIHLIEALHYHGPFNGLVALLGLTAIAVGFNRSGEARLRAFVGMCILALLTAMTTAWMFGYVD